MTLVVRTATEKDLAGVLLLYRQSGLDDEVLSEQEARAIFRRFARYPDYRLYVADEGGAIVGSFALLIMDNLGHLGAPSGVIEGVVVDPRRQRAGIGRAMMEFAVAECRVAGCYKTSLSANLKREHAHAFYESLSFERHGYSFRVVPGDVR